MNIFQRIKNRIQKAFYDFTDLISQPQQSKSQPIQNATYNQPKVEINPVKSIEESKEQSIIPLQVPKDIDIYYATPIQDSQLTTNNSSSNFTDNIIPETDNINWKLEKYKDKYQYILNEANNRLTKLEDVGVHSISEQEVWENGGYFTFFDSENITDAVNEVRRALLFLRSPGSTVEGAKVENIEMSSSQYEGLFGNNLQSSIENGFLDFLTVQRAYRNYRNIESLYGQITLYDSSKLIAAMYKWELEGQDSLVLASEYLKNKQELKMQEAEDKFNYKDEDYV